jgi:hypothetical protein
MRRALFATGMASLTAWMIAASPTQAVAAFAEKRVYAVCTDSAGDNHASAKIQNGKDVTWSVSGPSGDFANLANAGCFWVDNAAARTAPVRWAGTVKGNLKSLTAVVDLFVSASGTAAPVAPFNLTAGLKIDGQQIPLSGPQKVTPVLVLKNAGLTDRVQFSITGLDQFVNGGVLEDGPGTAVHTVELTFEGDAPNVNWTWGAREVPSGVTFNGALAPAVFAPATGGGGHQH